MTSSRSFSGLFPGLLIIAIGIVWMLKVSGIYIPSWLFSWQMLLIIVGLYIGIKSNFMDLNYLIPLVVGVIFILNDYTTLSLGKYLIPVVLIAIGVILLLKTIFKRKSSTAYNELANAIDDVSAEGVVKIDAMLSGIKKSLDLQTFKGGVINCMLANVDLNLRNSVIEGTVLLEVNSLLGSVKIILPHNVKLVSEVQAIMGDVDDKRFYSTTQPSATILLKGSALLGGIAVRN
ncbi:MAG: LiaF transmembrane domain-containing protein [Thermaurantimonas sp.]|uniref:LiaF transmembrane domain-containing protein n=1 Tax=Thermaurantimonas sp. TaxID=2681568 RepID=UPI00391B381B